MKKATALVSVLIFILSSIIVTYTSDMGTQYVKSFGAIVLSSGYNVWRIDEVSRDYTITYGPYEFFYEGSPAEYSGEVDTISSSRAVSNDYSGSIAIGLKKRIELTLGYSFTDTSALSSGKQSRALEKGEYVRGYWRPIYSQSKVVQRQYYRLDGYEIPTGVTMTCYGKKATGIGLKLEYYSASGTKLHTGYCISANKICTKAFYPTYPLSFSVIR